MSENLKRAESLFNRIMNPGAPTTDKASNSYNHSHSKYRKPNSNNHNNHNNHNNP